MKKIILGLIRLYQKTRFFHSPLARFFFLSNNQCRFSPTCSDYTYAAVKKYGAVKGLVRGIIRIVRCNPFNRGGFDPVK